MGQVHIAEPPELKSKAHLARREFRFLTDWTSARFLLSIQTVDDSSVPLSQCLSRMIKKTSTGCKRFFGPTNSNNAAWHLIWSMGFSNELTQMWTIISDAQRLYPPWEPSKTSFNAFSLFLWLFTLQILTEGIITINEHMWNYVLNKKVQNNWKHTF